MHQLMNDKDLYLNQPFFWDDKDNFAILLIGMSGFLKIAHLEVGAMVPHVVMELLPMSAHRP